MYTPGHTSIKKEHLFNKREFRGFEKIASRSKLVAYEKFGHCHVRIKKIIDQMKSFGAMCYQFKMPASA